MNNIDHFLYHLKKSENLVVCNVLSEYRKTNDTKWVKWKKSW